MPWWMAAIRLHEKGLEKGDLGRGEGTEDPGQRRHLGGIIGASFGPLTGFAMNAARDFGPRLFAALAGWGTDVMTGYPLNDNLSLPYFLVPLIAPIIGACIGGWIYKRIIVVALDRNAAAEDKA